MSEVKISCRRKESRSAVMETLIALVEPQPPCTIIRYGFDGGSQVLIMIREIIEYKIRKYHTSVLRPGIDRFS